MIVEGKDRIFCKKLTLNCGGQIVDLSTPKVMGILNVTPDSFHDGGKYNSEQKAVQRAGEMLEEGADILDIGGYSSRPGAEHVNLEEERKRTIPIIKAIKLEYPEALLSIDTFRSEIAKEAIGAGAGMVNDISGGDLDSNMFSSIADLQVPYVLMHMRGTPQNMQRDTEYENLMRDVLEYFQTRMSNLRELGVKDIILDPGFGFGKSIDGNYQLLHKLKSLDIFEVPVLVGLSRKSMIQKVMGADSDASLQGTKALNLVALLEGASILRVHDVKEARDIIALNQRLS